MKRPLVALALLLAILVPASASNALTRAAKAPSVSGPCTKLNAMAKAGTTSLVCQKVGKKLLWQKAIAKAKPTLSAKPSSSASASEHPTTTPTPTPSSAPAIAPQSSYEITVDAKTFFWTFRYAVHGEKTLRTNSQPTLYLPVGKPVQLTVASTDVSHGFWIPALGIDQEASPETAAHITITAEKIGKFPGACNIQCGRGHTGMTMTAEVVSESDYLKIIGGL